MCTEGNPRTAAAIGVAMALAAFSRGADLTGTAPLPLAAVRTWAYQLQGLEDAGAVNALAASRYDLLVVEPTRTERDSRFDAPAMVRHLQASPAGDGRHRKLVLAYISIGEAEDFRWYWTWSKSWKKNQPRPASLPSFIVHPDPDGWSGCFPVAFWDPAWKDILLAGRKTPPAPDRPYRSVLDEVLQSGFDGVYLDWVEAYDEPAVKREARKAGVKPAREMIRLLGEIREYGRRRNPAFLVIQQNGAALLEAHPELLSVVDAIGQEDVWHAGVADSDWGQPAGHDQRTPPEDTRESLRLLRLFRAAGKPVFTIDYTVADADGTYRRARAEGFVPYCTQVSLSRLTTTPPPGLAGRSSPHREVTPRISPSRPR
jgi:cysteinyl-tRNA synthetase, unknown class